MADTSACVLGRRGETDWERAKEALARGRHQEALEAVRRARRRRPSTEAHGLALAEADALLGLLRYREAVSVATRALARRPQEADLAVRLRLVRGQGLWLAGRVAPGRGEIEKASAQAVAPLTRARVQETLGLFAWKAQDLEEALVHLEKARALFASCESTGGLLRVLEKEAGVLRDAGRLEEALRTQDERLTVAAASERPDALALAHSDRGGLLTAMGRWEEARIELEGAAELFRDAGDSREFTVAGAGRVVVDLASGDLAGARMALERAREINAERGDMRALAENLLLSSDVHLAAGEAEAAERTAVESLGLFRLVQDGEGECRSRVRRAQALIALRRIPEAVREGRRAQRAASDSRPDLQALAHLALGRALLRFEKGQAAPAFARALAVSEGRPMLAHAAQLGLAGARGLDPNGPEVSQALDGLESWGDRRVLAYGLADVHEVLGASVRPAFPDTGREFSTAPAPLLAALVDAAACLFGEAGGPERWAAAMRAVRRVLPWWRAILVGGPGWEVRSDLEKPVPLAEGDLSRRLAAQGTGARIVDLQTEPAWRSDPTRVLHGLGCALLAPVSDSLTLYVDLREDQTPPAASSLGLLTELARLLGLNPPASAAEAAPEGFPGILGRCPAMEELYRRMSQIAPSELSVHVRGETGTGKEMVAQALHSHSRRRQGPFVALNASSLSDELFEAEMCGHTRGAFTGAVLEREGHLSAASGGTLFLDEVTDLSPRAQGKLLRLLETREYRRLGESRLRKADFRLVTASNAPLESRLRPDLIFRLCDVTLDLPPLRHRGRDLWLLAEEFVRRAAAANGTPAPAIGGEARRALQRHAWPGNVRELQSEMRKAVVFAGRGPIRPEHLSAALSEPTRRRPRALKEALQAFERQHVATALEHHGGNRVRTAEALGISRQSLVSKIARWGL